MSGGTTTRYEEIGADRPLFGEARPRDRVANLIVGAFTALVVTVTVVSGFIFPAGGPKGVNIYFACCIVFILGSHLILIYWYRQGDLEPKFRTLIYFNAFTIILLSVCANLYIHDLGK